MPEQNLRRSARNLGKRTISQTADDAPRPATKRAREVKKGQEPATKDNDSNGAPPKHPVLKQGDHLPDSLPTVQTHDGETVNVSQLVEQATSGIVIFAYPRASTPGCTTQACLFRDNRSEFEEAGFQVFGLSGDSPSANTKFRTKHGLQMPLLCDPGYALHQCFQIKKNPKGTIRSVIVIKKGDSGAVIVRKSAASPAASLQIARDAIASK